MGAEPEPGFYHTVTESTLSGPDRGLRGHIITIHDSDGRSDCGALIKKLGCPVPTKYILQGSSYQCYRQGYIIVPKLSDDSKPDVKAQTDDHHAHEEKGHSGGD